MKILLTTILLLHHIESGDVDLVESCKVEGDTIHVNFGYNWEVEFPADQYECSTYEKVRAMYETN